MVVAEGQRPAAALYYYLPLPRPLPGKGNKIQTMKEGDQKGDHGAPQEPHPLGILPS